MALPTCSPRWSRWRIVSTVLLLSKLSPMNSGTFSCTTGRYANTSPTVAGARSRLSRVAYLVCDAFGLASDGYSFAYVANWSRGEMAVVIEAADKVRKCATTILESLSVAETLELVAA